MWVGGLRGRFCQTDMQPAGRSLLEWFWAWQTQEEEGLYISPDQGEPNDPPGITSWRFLEEGHLD